MSESKVELEISQSNDQLTLIIRDNGKNENENFQEGKGMSLGRERLEIIKKQVGDKVNASILTSADQDGFRVQIHLPLDL